MELDDERVKKSIGVVAWIILGVGGIYLLSWGVIVSSWMTGAESQIGVGRGLIVAVVFGTLYGLKYEQITDYIARDLLEVIE